MAWLRRAGRGTLPDGATVLWSVAEGSRGRRWRWTVTDGDRIRHIGMMELEPTGTFARLELDAAHSMVTLHPDGTAGRAHGNIVGPTGVRPLSIEWQDGAGVAIEGDRFGSALCPGVGEPLLVGGSGARRVGAAEALTRDQRGVPVLADPQEWALEE